MEEKETQRLLKMDDELKEKVIGQDQGVIAISKVLRCSRADLKDPRRPIGSFVFLELTGVGKTYLARNLAEFIKKQNVMGFGALGGNSDQNYDSMKEKLTEQARKVFKPEFLNRLDDLIVFHLLERDDLIRIVDLEVGKVVNRLAQKQIVLELQESGKDLLIKKGYDPSYGARPMRRAVERYLEDPLAERLLKGEVSEGDTVSVTLAESSDDNLTFQVLERSESGQSKAQTEG